MNILRRAAMDLISKCELLYQIAADDPIYQVWRCSYEELAPAFRAYAASQPEAVQRLLLGYMEAWCMMQQKLVNLACEHMDFPTEGANRPKVRKKSIRRT